MQESRHVSHTMMALAVTAAAVMICDLGTIDLVTGLSDDTNREEFRGST